MDEDLGDSSGPSLGAALWGTPRQSPSPSGSKAHSPATIASEGSRGLAYLPSGTDDTYYIASGSQASEDSGIPDAVLDFDWSGMGTVVLPKCEHGHHAILKKCWGRKNTGRRFLGCSVLEPENQCQIVFWVDEPWPRRVGESFKLIWPELKTVRCAEERTTEQLYEVVQFVESLVAAKQELEEKVHSTKRVARRVCADYQKKTLVIAMDKSKLLDLTWCLMGLVVSLLVVMLFVKL